MHQKNLIYHKRRQELIASVRKQYPDLVGSIVIFSRFEHGRHRFLQDSSFYYLTGVQEPGAALLLALDGAATLYIPAFTTRRAQWVDNAMSNDQKTAEELGFVGINYLGDPQPGYEACPLFSASAYRSIVAAIEKNGARATVFTCVAQDAHHYVEQYFILERLKTFSAAFAHIVDISPMLARMRRKKTHEEVELLYKAVEVTMLAHEAAACALGDGVNEASVQAHIEYVFTDSGASPAFPTIVGSGHNSTVLHYQQNNRVMRTGDVVVIDIGAQLQHYCADLTRTYPVSGKFTQRQREVYEIVLQTQEHIASQVKPGVWLCNKDRPQESLHHKAVAFLDTMGYAKYFPHGIGHFLGLDVHDVGDRLEPLHEGDVITIEPGIYIAAEKLGIRIEDNYWVVRDGVECLSAALPKSVPDIEAFAQLSMDDPNDNREQITTDEDDFDVQ